MKRGMQKCRPLAPEEIRRLLDACRADSSWKGERDLLLIALMAIRGLRASEVVAIAKRYVRDRNGVARASFVLPKYYTKQEHGNCLVVLPRGLRDLAERVARRRMRKGRGFESPALFRSRRGCALGRKDVWRIVKDRCAEAGVDPQRVGPHSFRRSLGRALNSEEGEAAAERLLGIRVEGLVLAQRALRHSNAKITRIYLEDATEEQAAEVAAAMLAHELGFD